MSDRATSSTEVEPTWPQPLETALVRHNGGSDAGPGVGERARLSRRCERLAQDLRGLTGPGATAVRAAARQLLVAIELYEQQRRRLAAEVLRDSRNSEEGL